MTTETSTYPELDAVITAQEAAELYGIQPVTVYKNIERGNIPARKSGGTWLIRRIDAEERWGKRQKAKG